MSYVIIINTADEVGAIGPFDSELEARVHAVEHSVAEMDYKPSDHIELYVRELDAP